MKIDELELLELIKDCSIKKEYKKGLELILENEDTITKKYYEIMPYKIDFYIKENKLIEASVLIKQELEVPYIPTDFEKFLKDRKKEIDFIFKDKQRNVLTFEDLENIDELDESTLLNILPKLKNFNLNSLKEKFQNIFSNEKISYLTKSLLIASLSDNKLDCDFVVLKENVLIKFNPANVFDIRDSENLVYINNQLKEFKDIEINTLNIVNNLIMTYLLYLYPLQLETQNCDELLCAAVIIASSMMNQTIKNEKIERIYRQNSQKINKLCEKINNLLETI